MADGQRKNRSKGYYRSLNALSSADFMEKRSNRRESPYFQVERVSSCRGNEGKVNMTLV